MTSEDRERILDAADGLFFGRPYDEVSIEEIADAAQVTHADVFGHFGSKKDVYVAALARLLTDFEAQVLPPPGQAGADAITAALRRYLAWVPERHAGYRSLIVDAAGRFDEVNALAEASRGVVVDRVTRLLGREGTADATLRVMLLAWVGMVERTALTWLDRRSGVDPEDLVKRLSAALWAIAD